MPHLAAPMLRDDTVGEITELLGFAPIGNAAGLVRPSVARAGGSDAGSDQTAGFTPPSSPPCVSRGAGQIVVDYARERRFQRIEAGIDHLRELIQMALEARTAQAGSQAGSKVRSGAGAPSQLTVANLSRHDRDDNIASASQAGLEERVSARTAQWVRDSALACGSTSGLDSASTLGEALPVALELECTVPEPRGVEQLVSDFEAGRPGGPATQGGSSKALGTTTDGQVRGDCR